MISAPAPDETRVIPLGGVGEFGANATIVETAEACLLIDCGLMFPPNRSQPGVDFYVLDPDWLLETFPSVGAVFLTHAHEDHIGGLSFLLTAKPLPVFAGEHTARLVEDKLRRNGLDIEVRAVPLNQPVTWNNVQVEFIGVTHSIPGACTLAIRTPGHTVVHSGDFKVDPLPGDGYPFQSAALANWGGKGVDLLIMDSTNADKAGFCPSDYEIAPNWYDLIAAAPGRVFFTTFASHMPRLRKLADIAERLDRRIAIIGRGLVRHATTAIDMGYLDPGDVFVSHAEALDLPREDIIYVVTGSQAEADAALSRILRTGFKGLSFQAGDTVIFAAKFIPGHGRQGAILISEMERLGVHVWTPRQLQIHSSGHGYREDLAYMLALTKPRTVAPIHGEYHQLLQHHRWLESLLAPDQSLLLLEDGNVVALTGARTAIAATIETVLLPIDGNQSLPLARQTLRERKDMMYSGMLMVAARSRPGSGRPRYEVATHGMAEGRPGAIASMLASALEELPGDAALHEDRWGELIAATVKRTLRPCFSGRPLLKIIVNGKICR